MSARGVLNVVGTAVGGLIGWTETPPAADPSAVRRLLEDLGLPSGADLAEGVRAFQARIGLKTDGIAGARTVHLLARYAKEARELHRLDLAAGPIRVGHYDGRAPRSGRADHLVRRRVG